MSPLQAPPLMPPTIAVELPSSSAPAPSAAPNAKQQPKPISASISTSNAPTIQQPHLPLSNQEASQGRHEALPRNSAPDSPTVDAAVPQASVFQDSGRGSVQFVGLPISEPSSRTQHVSPSGMSALRSGIRSVMSSNGGSALDTVRSNNNGPHPMGAGGGVG
jgi:hypothetical protein